jgi:hypothetical protein
VLLFAHLLQRELITIPDIVENIPAHKRPSAYS